MDLLIKERNEAISKLDKAISNCDAIFLAARRMRLKLHAIIDGLKRKCDAALAVAAEKNSA